MEKTGRQTIFCSGNGAMEDSWVRFTARELENQMNFPIGKGIKELNVNILTEWIIK
jgi:hypothetical protein